MANLHVPPGRANYLAKGHVKHPVCYNIDLIYAEIQLHLVHFDCEMSNV